MVSALVKDSSSLLTRMYRLADLLPFCCIGFLEARKIPFRLTPNIQSLIGPLLLQGRFIPSMVTVASALNNAHNDLEPALRLLLRDDIVAWYTSKSMSKPDAKTRDLEKQLMDRIMRNVMNIQTRIAECAPKVSSGEEEENKKKEVLKKDPVDLKVKELVKEATDPRRLCMMPSNYQAWL
jgi:phosphatidylinositol kinase/protein kinase (PI-3  family)